MLRTLPGSETSIVQNTLFSQCFPPRGGGRKINKNSSSSSGDGSGGSKRQVVVCAKKEVKEGEQRAKWLGVISYRVVREVVSDR